jgi:hypothetical protein
MKRVNLAASLIILLIVGIAQGWLIPNYVPYAHDAGDPPPTLVPMLEFSLRQALILYKGDWTVFFSKPIALVFLVLTVAFLWRFAWKPAKFMDK